MVVDIIKLTDDEIVIKKQQLECTKATRKLVGVEVTHAGASARCRGTSSKSRTDKSSTLSRPQGVVSRIDLPWRPGTKFKTLRVVACRFVNSALE